MAGRLISIDTQTGAVATLKVLPSPVVYAVSAFDRFNRTYFLLDSNALLPRMFSLSSGVLSQPFDLHNSNSAGHAIPLALAFDANSGLLFALTCEWPHSDSSPVLLVQYDPSRGRKVSELVTRIKGKDISFATFAFDFSRGQCLVN